MNKNSIKKPKRKRKFKKSFKITLAILIFIFIVTSLICVKLTLKSRISSGSINDVEVTDDEDGVVDISKASTSKATYTVIDVGCGEAIFIDAGKVEALIDAGDAAHGDKVVETIKESIDGDLDYLIVTADEEKRTGGLDKVCENFKIGAVYIGDTSKETKNHIKKIAGSKTKVSKATDTTLDLGKTSVLTLCMPDTVSGLKDDKSVGTLFRHNKMCFLATSNAGKEELAKLSGYIGDGTCSVLILPKYGTSTDKMPDLSAQYNIASNDGGSISKEMKESVNSLYSTYKSGNIQFVVKGNDLSASLQSRDVVE